MMLDSLEDQWDVIVVGAGPAGTAAAISCARLSLSVLLVDAKQFPRRKVCGGCLNQVSIGLLERLIGVDHELWREAVPLNRFDLSHRGRTFVFPMPTGRAVDRAAMDAALVAEAEAAGAKFVSPVTAKLAMVDGDRRNVRLTQGDKNVQLGARVVVLASGLGNRAVLNAAEADSASLQQRPSPSSRVGIEAIYQDFPHEYSAGKLHMAVGRDGYVGLTQIAGQRLHVAAALNRRALQTEGPRSLIEAILKESGAPRLIPDESPRWQGTPPLTAKAPHLGLERVFLVGDAAGYVEPFTGEGIRWALESGTAVASFAANASVAWKNSLVREWESWYSRTVGREQRLCRQITSGLKSATIRLLAHQVIRIRPRIASAIIARLNSESPS